MYYVGIDVSSKKHYVCILDKNKELIIKPFSIASDIQGLMLLSKNKVYYFG
ncbi:hypothetical protein [Nitrosophilus labii]|uniref:hypothetical protein n=1 Tax=Nitrosophilus labii TaxID=2706014 RepID=UPI001656AC7E|nr:hypothetical protein [Nitrosophilus labii]